MGAGFADYFHRNISKWVKFFSREKSPDKTPQLTSNPPQHHHKKTSRFTPLFSKPP
jgi:hypothetical protein